MIVSGKTDIGKVRKNNEDSIFICDSKIGYLPTLYIVADGMGGHKAGEIASSQSIEFFCEYIKTNECIEDNLKDYITEATLYSNSKVFEAWQHNDEYREMGTTFTACIIDDLKLYIAHVGDTRTYILSEGKLVQITSDHTYTNEMVKAGLLEENTAINHPKKKCLTRALGYEKNLKVDYLEYDLKLGDNILICSDGLYSMLDDEIILECLNNNKDTIGQVDCLINKANSYGGTDNISAISIAISKAGEFK